MQSSGHGTVWQILMQYHALDGGSAAAAAPVSATGLSREQLRTLLNHAQLPMHSRIYIKMV